MPTKDKTNSTKKKSSTKKSDGKQRKIKSKAPMTSAKTNVKTTKSAAPSSRCDLNKLTEANISSLRWDNVLTDPILDNDRIEQYKELRRQRYYEAREKAIQTLIQRMQIKTNDLCENSIVI